MDSSPVLRQQSQNKIHPEFQRMKTDQKKKPAVPKTSKLLSSSHRSNQDSENKDPGSSHVGRKTPVRPGGSRLPVLAKSLGLQAPANFSQSHSRWEEKPLAGKARKKKPCTRPVPFNFSQPRGSRTTAEKQPLSVLQSQTGTRAMQPEKNVSQMKPAKHPAVLTSGGISSKSADESAAKTPGATSHPPGPSGPRSTFRASPAPSSPRNWVHQNKGSTSVPPAVTAEVCVDDMKQLSLKDPSKTPHASQSTQHNPPREKENFQSDHTALLSILRNEGVSVSALPSATPQSKPSHCLPQRVSVMKSQQKTGPAAVRSVQFSPDPAALQSILLNEGVKAGGPAGATPRNSVCPPGRGTSIYTAQRVPLRKNRAEALDGAAAVALKETPLKKWTPQRVRDTRHRPMSAVKWHLSTLQSPYVTPGVRTCQNNRQPQQQEEVVQRLFDDQEDEPSTERSDQDPDAPAEQRQVQAPEPESSRDAKGEASRVAGEEAPAFFQVPHRESVIFFSTGKKLFRAAGNERQDSRSARPDQPAPVSLDRQQQLPPTHGQVPAESEPPRRINPSERLHRVQKTASMSPAVAILRKRLPPLEELRMDEEVATYTSLSAGAPPGFLPPRPRCGNPLASYLHFEESTRFVPISFSVPAGPASPLPH